MNILIENSDTQEYLAATGGWSKNPLVGKCFSDVGVAFRTARQEPVGKFNIVCHIVQTNQFINLKNGRGAGATDAVEK